jgi:hypothetical protein
MVGARHDASENKAAATAMATAATATATASLLHIDENGLT